MGARSEVSEPYKFLVFTDIDSEDISAQIRDYCKQFGVFIPLPLAVEGVYSVYARVKPDKVDGLVAALGRIDIARRVTYSKLRMRQGFE